MIFSADGDGEDENDEEDEKVEIRVVPLTSSCSKAAAVGGVSGENIVCV